MKKYIIAYMLISIFLGDTSFAEIASFDAYHYEGQLSEQSYFKLTIFLSSIIMLLIIRILYLKHGRIYMYSILLGGFIILASLRLYYFYIQDLYFTPPTGLMVFQTDPVTGRRFLETYSGILLFYKWGITQYGVSLLLQTFIIVQLARNLYCINSNNKKLPN